MKIEYDKIADAIHVYLKKGKVAKTVRMQNRLNVDVDKQGKIIGIEILDDSSQLPKGKTGRSIEVGLPAFA